MHIKLREITIRDLVASYHDDGEGGPVGIIGYGSRPHNALIRRRQNN